MTVALLIICHDDLGQAMLDTAVGTLTRNPMHTGTISVKYNADPEELVSRADEVIAQLDTGDGVLILTDLFGSTPSNIACRVSSSHDVRVVSGINLPMLIRTLNYPQLSLDLLAEKAFSGGRDGITSYSQKDCSVD